MGCGSSASVAAEPQVDSTPSVPVTGPVAEDNNPTEAVKDLVEAQEINNRAPPENVVDVKSQSHSKLDGNESLRGPNIFSNLAKIETHRNIRSEYELHTGNKGHDSVLGSGMSGAVKKIKRKSDGKNFAMKCIKLNTLDEETTKELINEIALLKSMDHPHIARLYEAYEESDYCVRLVMELCAGGELFDRLMDKSHFNEHECAHLLFQMLSALEYLHEVGVVHRDLKLENWLFRTKDDDSEIVLIDFGLSKKYKPSEHMHSRVGTSYYIAPEVLKGDYTSACDLWSLGS